MLTWEEVQNEYKNKKLLFEDELIAFYESEKTYFVKFKSEGRERMIAKGSEIGIIIESILKQIEK
ncbi:hypothetical protein ACO3UB_08510 (plasmid) [Methanocaldococcus sp. 16A]